VEDFILSGKVFCGQGLSPMTGISGMSHTGKLYSYYKEKSKKCKNLTVTKRMIEDKVIEVVQEMLTDGNQKLIARVVSLLCQADLCVIITALLPHSNLISFFSFLVAALSYARPKDMGMTI
jgi:hypothetical protein